MSNKHADLGYFNGTDEQAAALHRIRAGVHKRLQDQPGFKTVNFCDVSAYTIQADLEHVKGAMGGYNLPHRVEIVPQALGMPARAPYPRSWGPRNIAHSEAEAIELIVNAWPKDPEAALKASRDLQAYFSRYGCD